MSRKIAIWDEFNLKAEFLKIKLERLGKFTLYFTYVWVIVFCILSLIYHFLYGLPGDWNDFFNTQPANFATGMIETAVLFAYMLIWIGPFIFISYIIGLLIFFLIQIKNKGE